MDMAKFKSMFLSETEEHLRNMNALLVTVEENLEDQPGINALFREAHSIKGMAASMGYEGMARLAHHLEEFLAKYRTEGKISPPAVKRLLAGVDLLEGLLEDLAAGLPERDIAAFIGQREPVGEEGQDAPEPQNSYTLKVILHDEVVLPCARMLQIIGQLEGLGVITAQFPDLEQIMSGRDCRRLHVSVRTKLGRREFEETFRNYPEIRRLDFTDEEPLRERRKQDRRQRDRRAHVPAVGTVRVDTQLLDRFINLTGELVTNRHRLQTALSEQSWGALNDGLGQLGKLVKTLHGQVLQVRMMPLGSVTDRLYGVVRELCRKSGKEVTLKVEGAEIELDRTILEEMTEPLMHMVRNAVDHGIEKQGEVQIKAWRERSSVRLQIEDNGRGIDTEKVRARALQKGLISSRQAQAMQKADLLQLICQPGFSTHDEVTETSGRGVGMDVVKTAVEKLGGTLQIDSAPGAGTRLLMRLPLSVAIIRILLIECADKLMALPISRVLQTHQAVRQEVQSTGKQLTVQLKEEKLPLLSLRKILGMAIPPAVSQISIIVMELFGRKVGLVVDRIVGHQEVYVKQLPTPFDRLRGTNGGAILGDGRVVFLLDVESFLERRR